MLFVATPSYDGVNNDVSVPTTQLGGAGSETGPVQPRTDAGGNVLAMRRQCGGNDVARTWQRRGTVDTFGTLGKKFALGGDPWVLGDRGDAVLILALGQERIGPAAHDRHFITSSTPTALATGRTLRSA